MTATEKLNQIGNVYEEVIQELKKEEGYDITDRVELTTKLLYAVNDLLEVFIDEELKTVNLPEIDQFFDHPVNALMEAQATAVQDPGNEDKQNEVQQAVINFLHMIAKEADEETPVESSTGGAMWDDGFCIRDSKQTVSLFDQVADFDEDYAVHASVFMDCIEEKFRHQAPHREEHYLLLRFYLSQHPYIAKAEVDLMTDHQVHLAFKQLTLGKAE
jgi:hypothetical protein